MDSYETLHLADFTEVCVNVDVRFVLLTSSIKHVSLCSMNQVTCWCDGTTEN